MSYQSTLKAYKQDKNLIVDIQDFPELSKGLNGHMFDSAGFKLDRENNVYQVNINLLKKVDIFALEQRLKGKNIIIDDESGIFESSKRKVNEIKNQDLRIKDGGDIKINPTTTKLILPNFTRKLKPFQEVVVKHNIVVENAANFSCPGSGKTTMMYANYSHLKYERKMVEKILVICPISAFPAWETEYKGCFDVEPNSVRLNGGGRDKYYNYADKNELFLINYATLCNDTDKIIELLKRYDFMVILDESHYVKNISQDAAWASAVLSIAEYAKARFISSGTPAPNDIKDFWTQMTFLMGGDHVFYNRVRFLEEIKNDKSRKKLMEKVRNLSHRVTKSDLNLPPIEINKVRIEMSSVQREIYNLIADELFEEIASMSNRDAQIVLDWKKIKVIRLRQISSNLLLLKDNVGEFRSSKTTISGKSPIEIIENYDKYEVSPKITATINLVKEKVDENKRVLVWADFVSNILELEERLISMGIKVFKVYGEIPKDPTSETTDSFTREGQMAAFKENEGSVLIANPQTMAEAVSLHRECHVAIYMDRSFNCAHWMQSKDRIHRVGLEDNIITEYYIIENKNSIDEIIDIRLVEKEIIMNEILENEVPVATGEFNGKDFGENEDFNAVLEHIKSVRGE